MRLLLVLGLFVSACVPPLLIEVDAGTDAGSEPPVDAGVDAGLCAPVLSTAPLAKWVMVGAGQQATDTSLPVVRPGGQIELVLRRLDCCYAFHDEPVCATWEVVSPVDATLVTGANGRAVLSVGQLPGGTLIQVDAHVGNARITGGASVVVAANSALEGLWHEVDRRSCDGGALGPYQPVGELRLGGDGNVQVTWIPFERYVDYWGTWTLRPSGAISFVRTGGNAVPTDFDGEGHWSLDAGQLTLSEMFLGASPTAATVPSCAQVFTR